MAQAKTAASNEPGTPAGAVELLDVSGLGDLVRQRRGPMSIRQTAEEIGVSFSTLSRVENGAQPDLTSFTRICAWLGVSPSRFFTSVAERQTSSIEDIVVHLHQDPRLSDRAATLIAGMLSDMYDKLATATIPTAPLVACHLRAAPTLRPGVPDRLGGILRDLQSALEQKVEDGLL